MFDNIKKLHELKKMQDSFKKERLVFEDRGVSVTINGAFEIEEIKLNPELEIQDQQEALKHCLNKAREEIQKTLAQKMMQSGFGI